MPTYEFRCRACGDTFTQSRPMSDSAAPAACPNGHDDTRRLLSVAGVSRSRGESPSGSPASGGCCGGSCGCG